MIAAGFRLLLASGLEMAEQLGLTPWLTKRLNGFQRKYHFKEEQR
jgi:hypothetical protein